MPGAGNRRPAQDTNTTTCPLNPCIYEIITTGASKYAETCIVFIVSSKLLSAKYIPSQIFLNLGMKVANLHIPDLCLENNKLMDLLSVLISVPLTHVSEYSKTIVLRSLPTIKETEQPHPTLDSPKLNVLSEIQPKIKPQETLKTQYSMPNV